MAGGAVTWKYYVTNSGNVVLGNVSVTDNQGVVVTCPQTTLAVGASMTCTATGTNATTREHIHQHRHRHRVVHGQCVAYDEAATDGSSLVSFWAAIATDSSLCIDDRDYRTWRASSSGRYSPRTRRLGPPTR